MEKINYSNCNGKSFDISPDLFNSNSRYYNFIQEMNRFPWKIFYKGILPGKIKKIIDRQADYHQQEYVKKCWDKVIGDYFIFIKNGGKGLSEHVAAKKKIEGRKVIWQYWGTGWNEDALPDIVRLCRKSVERYKGEYEVILLDDDNLEEYISFPEFIYEKKKNGKINLTFFSDILRLALLNVYGGVWLDATILLTAPLLEEYSDMGYFVFQRDSHVKDRKYWEKLNNDYFSWDKRHSVNMLNSIIFSQKGDKVIETLLNLLLLFWERRDRIPHYFLFQIMYEVLMVKYMAADRCRVEDDTLPHILFSMWNDNFDEAEYNKIIKQINMHKLTYKSVNEKNCKKESFYDYCIKDLQEYENGK